MGAVNRRSDIDANLHQCNIRAEVMVRAKILPAPP